MVKVGGEVVEKLRPTVEFYKHQAEGVRFILRSGNVLLADEMGLGKSLQALAVAAIDFQRGTAKRVLIVAPATVKGNWAEEIKRHTTFTCHVLSGSPKQRAKQLEEFSADVLIVNYEQVISGWEALNGLGPDIIIYDEAHAIKNRTSKRTKACMKLEARRQICVTGSPLLNHVDDLWTLLHRLDPDAWPNYWRFRNRYCVFGGYMGKAIVGVKHEQELHEALSSIMLRRLKAEVLDLPEKQVVRSWVDLEPVQRTLYDEALKEQQITIPGDPNPMQIENALTKFLRLKEICGSAGTIEGYDDISAKLDRAVETIQEIIDSGEPVVVFTQFRKILAFLNDRLERAGVETFQLHGDIKQSERVPTINSWTGAAGAGEPGAILAMFQVGGVGLNMTAASKIILVDKLFVPKLNDQAIDRVHRIGVDLTKPVQIIELICRKTVEQRVEKILDRKERVFGAVVEGDQEAFKRELVRSMLAGEDDD